jgi:nicotinamidase-related amidase
MPMSEHEQVAAMLNAKNGAPIELDPACTALIIVDMQRYFTQPSFPFTDFFERLSPGVCSGYLRRVRERVIPSIRLLLDHFRKNGSLVVFTAVGTETKDGSDLACWARALDETAVNLLGSPVHPPVGDPSWQIDPELQPRPEELVVNKLSAGTFATTDLADQLRSRGVDRVVITGVVTDVCVSTTAREAADRNFRVVVVSDACTTFSEKLHQANLETLHVFGWVRGTEDVIRLTRRTQATVSPIG